MHGIIHRSLKQYVIDRASDDAWDRIADVADAGGQMYLPVSEYDDEEFVDVLSAIADLTDHPVSAVQQDFGGYFAPQMLETFGALIHEDWGGMDVIANLDRLYPKVVGDDNADEAEVAVDRPGDGTVVVGFSSPRGLSYMLEGIVRGIAREYGIEVNVDRDEETMPHQEEVRLIVRRDS